VTYPALAYADLPYPGCPSGYVSYGNPGLGSQFCVPPAYEPQEGYSCPAGSQATMGPVFCVKEGSPQIVQPVPSPTLPPIAFTSLPSPACLNGDVPAGTLTTVTGALHCVAAVYLPRTGYSCPAGSEPLTDPAPLCFTAGTKDTIVAPVPSS
jgi:hypothetical protein